MSKSFNSFLTLHVHEMGSHDYPDDADFGEHNQKKATKAPDHEVDDPATEVDVELVERNDEASQIRESMWETKPRLAELLRDFSDKEVEFCFEVAHCKNGTQAAQKVWPEKSYSGAACKASNIRTQENWPEIQKLIKEVMLGDAVADLQEILKFWSNIMRDPQMGTGYRMKASENLATALGVSQKVEHEVSSEEIENKADKILGPPKDESDEE